jgi:hypothetical protein
MRLHIPTVAAVVLVCGGGVMAQSLGDVARKEEERRKSVKDPGKVYTNKDLSTSPASSAPAPSASEATPAAAGASPKPASPPAAGDKPAEAAPVKDQTYWSNRMKGLREQLERDETYVAALQNRVSSLTADFVNRDDPAQRATIGADRQKAASELERLTKQIEAGKKAIADLEEEARRAGVPPGWLR